MKISIKDLTDEELMRRSCDMTRKNGLKPSNISRAKLLQCEHSPVRMIKFWIELLDIPVFASTHIVRHFIGNVHFAQTKRDDRGGEGDSIVTRLTPTNHGIDTNAQSLINMSRKRLCYNSHRTTVMIWWKVKQEMKKVCKDTSDYMVPECVYRGFCPELKQCKPGVKNVLKAYKDSPISIERAKQLNQQ
jgi:hypothetical protein